MAQHNQLNPGLANFFIKEVLALAVLLQLGLTACSPPAPPAPPELEAGAEVVHFMMLPRNLSRSTFTAVLPNGTPRQFVSWLFSDLGAAEWPESEAMAESDPMVKEQAQAIRAPLVPKNVAFFHTAPHPGKGKQMVIKWDDARRVVIVEGYVDPEKPPVLVREWEFPQVSSADPLAQQSAQSAIQAGGSYQSF